MADALPRALPSERALPDARVRVAPQHAPPLHTLRRGPVELSRRHARSPGSPSCPRQPSLALAAHGRRSVGGTADEKFWRSIRLSPQPRPRYESLDLTE